MYKNGSLHEFSPLADQFDKVDKLSRTLWSAVMRPARVVEVCNRLVYTVLTYFELSLYPTLLNMSSHQS